MTATHVRTVLACAVAVAIISMSEARAITIASANQASGKTPSDLAIQIVDASTGVLVTPGTANFNINDVNNPGTPAASDERSIGNFTDGITAPGTLLPTNQNATGTATFAGGIGILDGVCLCTGLVTDAEDGLPIELPLGNGLEGPNNGLGQFANPGEMNTLLTTHRDADFEAATGLVNSTSGDASVLQFGVEILKPSFLRISFVFGSDEVPDYLDDPYNDSVAILIGPENVADIVVNSSPIAFELQEIALCQELFVHNDTAPSPESLRTSPHAQPNELLYDIELGGFTTLLTRETKKVLAPGKYTVKIVIQDVADLQVDSAVFIPTDGLKARSFMCADFDLDGDVDADDLDIVLFYFNQSVSCFEEGDATGDGMVDGDDLDLVLFNFNTGGGHADYEADFNYDGQVDGLDLAIFNQYNGLLLTCASRAEGDADLDGKVDNLDKAIFDQQVNSTSGSAFCGTSAMATGGGAVAYQIAPRTAATVEMKPERFAELDRDKDGDLDRDDVRLWAEYLKAN